MLARLVLRNCLRSGARSAFLVLSVAAALLVNGLYLSYAQRVEAQSKLAPGQFRLIVVNPAGAVEACRAKLVASPSVTACESLVITHVFAGTAQVETWSYERGSRLVTPYVLPGASPDGGAVVPETTARALGLGVGDELRLFDPAGQEGGRALTVGAVSRDPLWPMVLVPTDDLAQVKGESRLLVALAPGTAVRDWLKWLGREARAEGTPLEEWPATGNPAGDGAAGAEGQEAAAGGGLAAQLQRSLAGLIVLVAALGIADGTALSLVERSGETALLRALGVSAGRITLMLAGEALALTVAGLGAALGVAAAAAWAVPGWVGPGLPACVLRGGFVAVGVSLAASLIVIGAWHTASPLTLLRRRVG